MSDKDQRREKLVKDVNEFLSIGDAEAVVILIKCEDSVYRGIAGTSDNVLELLVRAQVEDTQFAKVVKRSTAAYDAYQGLVSTPTEVEMEIPVNSKP
jgi:hypothetical protein